MIYSDQRARRISLGLVIACLFSGHALADAAPKAVIVSPLTSTNETEVARAPLRHVSPILGVGFTTQLPFAPLGTLNVLVWTTSHPHGFMALSASEMRGKSSEYSRSYRHGYFEVGVALQAKAGSSKASRLVMQRPTVRVLNAGLAFADLAVTNVRSEATALIMSRLDPIEKGHHRSGLLPYFFRCAAKNLSASAFDS
jgi:hypothetical protein